MAWEKKRKERLLLEQEPIHIWNIYSIAQTYYITCFIITQLAVVRRDADAGIKE